MAAPELIAGNVFADERGRLRCVNGFDLTRVKRFYTIANSADNPRRGWIMHRRENKWFFPMSGKTTIHAGDERFLLEAEKPCVLQMPAGNWFMIEQDGTAEVMVFSDCKVGEFEDDDLRRPL